MKPGKPGDALKASIRIVDLYDNPEYEALSYKLKETSYEREHVEGWSGHNDGFLRAAMDMKHAVYFGDGFVPINIGLRDAMLRLRDPYETKTYWIDQICINQRRFAERRFQVSFMMITFDRAHHMMLWTDEAGSDGGTAFEILRKLDLAYTICEQYPFSPEELVADENLDLPDFDSPLWIAVFQFFRRPVFERYWVIQEVVVAQQLTVRCGDEYLPWGALQNASRLLCSVPGCKHYACNTLK